MQITQQISTQARKNIVCLQNWKLIRFQAISRKGLKRCKQTVPDFTFIVSKSFIINQNSNLKRYLLFDIADPFYGHQDH